MILVEILECVNVNLSPLPHKRTQRQSRYEAFAKGAEDQVCDITRLFIRLRLMSLVTFCVLKYANLSIRHPRVTSLLFVCLNAKIYPSGIPG
jgi:hypothetical protein